MTGSPYRRSSPDRSKRYERRHSRSRSNEDRFYGGQSKKKVHTDYAYKGKDRRDQREQRFQRRPQPQFQKKQTIEVKFNNPPSQIKVHFRFKPLKINPKNEDQLIDQIKRHISSNIGPVEHFERSFDSRPGFLMLQMGFKYDHDAMLYLSGKKGQFQVKLNKEVLNLTADPTKTFKLIIPDLSKKSKKRQRSISYEKKIQKSKQRSKEKTKKTRRRENSNSHSRSSSSSSSRSYSRRSKDSRRQSRIQRYPQTQYLPRNDRGARAQRGQRLQRTQRVQRVQRGHHQQKSYQPKPYPKQSHYKQPQSTPAYQQGYPPVKQGDDSKKYKTLFFFGIHYSVNSKDMTKLLYNHEVGPFYSRQFIWRKMPESICQYLEARFQQHQAYKLLQLSDKLQVKGHPFIIIDGQSRQNQSLLMKLADYQVNIQFPKHIEPYYLLKSLKECGRLIQIISNNNLTQQGRSDDFNVTFNSRQVCNRLKEVKTTRNGITVEAVTDQNIMKVYRPNQKTQLMSYSQKDHHREDQRKPHYNDRNSSNSRD